MHHGDIELNRFNFKECLKNEVLNKFHSMNKFAKHTGMNPTTLGLIFKNEQGLSPDRLDLITKALGYSPGHFYNEYVNECYLNGHIHYSKVSDFLYSCYKHDKVDVAERIKSALYNDTDKGKVVQTVLEVAEKLYLNGKVKESEEYYDYIIKREEAAASSRLAIAIFRKYSILRERDNIEMIKVFLYKLIDVVYFIPLSVTYFHDDKETVYNLQAEAYFLITRYFNSMEDWNNTFNYAKKIQESSDGNQRFNAESLLYQFSSLRERGRIEEALAINREISGMSDYYSRLAKGNELLIRVEGGDQSCIPSIMDWITIDDELKIFLPIMIECYITNNNLDQAKHTVSTYAHLFDEPFHSVKLLNQRRKSRLFLVLSDLHFKLKENLIASGYLAKAIEICLDSQNIKRFQSCMLLMMNNLHNISATELQIVQESMKGSDINHVKT